MVVSLSSYFTDNEDRRAVHFPQDLSRKIPTIRIPPPPARLVQTQKEREWTEDERQAKREGALRLDLGRHLCPRYRGDEWTEREKRLLGTLPDHEVARRIGRTPNAVRIKREQMVLPNPESRAWTADELALLGTETDAKVAERIGGTRGAVAQKRFALGMPPAHNGVRCQTFPGTRFSC
jgi:hypothetical protein